MENRNCPGCGAPYNTKLNQCPYCSTSYFDLTSIDFTSNKPIYVKFKLPYRQNECVMTQMAIPRLDSIEFRNDTCDVLDLYGNTVHKFYSGRTAQTNIHFDAVANIFDEMIRIEVN